MAARVAGGGEDLPLRGAQVRCGLRPGARVRLRVPCGAASIAAHSSSSVHWCEVLERGHGASANVEHVAALVTLELLPVLLDLGRQLALPRLAAPPGRDSVWANHWLDAPTTSTLGCCGQPAASKVPQVRVAAPAGGQVLLPAPPRASRMLRLALQLMHRISTLAPEVRAAVLHPQPRAAPPRGRAALVDEWRYGKSSRCPATQLSTKRAATASGRLLRARGQSACTNLRLVGAVRACR